MKQLTLLRHAKSSWMQPELADHERPLSQRGKRDAPRIGARLLARKARPSLILTSPAKRALKTAKIVAQTLGYPKEFLQVERALYVAGPADILAVVAAQDDGFSSLMVVGHNPGLTELVNELVPELEMPNLPTAGVVAMELDTDRWSQAAEARATLVYYDYPKNPELLVIED